MGTRGAGQRRAWLKRLAHNSMRAEFERAIAGKLPENWHEAVAALKHGIADLRPFYESDVRWLRHYGFNPLAPTMLHEGV